jgi:hypothetical protein
MTVLPDQRTAWKNELIRAAPECSPSRVLLPSESVAAAGCRLETVHCACAAAAEVRSAAAQMLELANVFHDMIIAPLPSVPDGRVAQVLAADTGTSVKREGMW